MMADTLMYNTEFYECIEKSDRVTTNGSSLGIVKNMSVFVIVGGSIPITYICESYDYALSKIP